MAESQSQVAVPTEQIYTLGLGKLNADMAMNKARTAEEREELIFIRREKEREQELAQAEQKLSLPIDKKATYSKPLRTGTIRQLYQRAENYDREAGKGTLSLQDPFRKRALERRQGPRTGTSARLSRFGVQRALAVQGEGPDAGSALPKPRADAAERDCSEQG
ncbi:MAG: hypothetical protein P4L67_01860 [Candidatus Pacebacteria bacterium]|nr:hypothetical protein [Candidatus Paceibacterota bacterium]